MIVSQNTIHSLENDISLDSSISLSTDSNTANSLIMLDTLSQKISPGIQEKLERFENDESKRKAEYSPELTKKEKKKLRNQVKYAKNKSINKEPAQKYMWV